MKQLIENNTVISLDRTETKIKNLKETLPKVVSIKTDVTSNEDLDRAINQINSLYGKIDVLINNAGYGGTFDFLKMTEADMKTQMQQEVEINYLAPVILPKKALSLLENPWNQLLLLLQLAWFMCQWPP